MLVFIENFVDIWKHGIKVCDKIDFRFTVVVCFLIAYKCQMSLALKKVYIFILGRNDACPPLYLYMYHMFFSLRCCSDMVFHTQLLFSFQIPKCPLLFVNSIKIFHD